MEWNQFLSLEAENRSPSAALYLLIKVFYYPNTKTLVFPEVFKRSLPSEHPDSLQGPTVESLKAKIACL